MSLVPKFVPPDPAARMTLHPTVKNKTTFLAFAEYVDAKEHPNYVFNMLLAQLEVLDPGFKTWRAAHPDAGASATSKPARRAKKAEGRTV